MRQRRPPMDRENAVVPGSMVRRSNCGRCLTAPPKTGSPRKSPVYGERGITIQFLCRDLLWRPLRRVLRLVLVGHPTRGRSIFITTDIAMPPIEVIRLYGLRFKIELSFKQALRVLGVYAYHFWMSSMDKITRGSRTQYLHRKNRDYRDVMLLGGTGRTIATGPPCGVSSPPTTAISRWALSVRASCSTSP
jgi:hypothetical protein